MTPDSTLRRASPLACTVIALVGVFVFTGCWYSGAGTRRDARPVVDDTTRRGAAHGGATAGDNGTDGRGQGQSGAAFTHTDIPRVPPLPDRQLTVPNVLISATREGLSIAAGPAVGRFAEDTVHIELALPHGKLSGADANGRASLAAHTVLARPRPSSGRPGLRAAIEDLGGTITVDVDRAFTRFRIAVHQQRWRAACTDLLDAIHATTLSAPDQDDFDRAQRAVLLAALAEHRRDATQPLVDWVLVSAGLGKHPIEGLQDQTPETVHEFVKMSYRPAGACLSAVGGIGGSQFVSTAKQAANEWLKAHPPAGSTPERSIPDTLLPGGVYSIVGDVPTIAMVAVQIPPAIGAEAAAMRIAAEALAGPTGRIARAVRGLGGAGYASRVRSQWRTNGAGHILVLEVPVPGDQAAAFTAAVAVAQSQIAVLPLTPDELATATTHAQLRLARDVETPSLWCSTNVQNMSALGTPKSIQETAAALSDPSALDLTKALTALGLLPPTIVVAGRDLPADLVARSIALGPLRDPDTIATADRDVKAQIAAGWPYLLKALSAAGDADVLLKVKGCSLRDFVQLGAGPSINRLVAYDRDKRRLYTLQVVLGTKVLTAVDGDEVRTSSDGQSLPTPADEAQSLIETIERHPLFLLVAAARKECKYRLVGLRPVEGREMAVLERVDASRPRVRMFVDTESGLVRRVQSQAFLSGIGETLIEESFSDYRTTAGTIAVRVPWLRTTRIGSTDLGSKTTTIEFVPVPPPPQAFEHMPK